MDEHIFYDYLEEYSAFEVFNMLNNDENLFSPLINPSMYQKALNEFTKFGELKTFPTKYIYQWFGIIMKNTAILSTLTDIAGHSSYFPIDDFIEVYFDGERELFDEYKERLGEDHDFSAAWEYLEHKGICDKMKLPDGSDAWSDYGLEPILKLIKEYNENLTPEQVLVLINKILDVTHARGDLASMFIEGGSKTLSMISSTGYINEEKYIAYHGSPSREIVTGKFKKGKTGYLGPGIYFSEDKDYSRRYAKKMGSGSLYTVEIILNKPLIVTSDNPTKEFLKTIYKTDTVYNKREAKQSNITYLINSSDVKKFLNLGYDGVIWDYADNKEYVLYDNSNIKILNNEFINENKQMSNMENNKSEKISLYKKYFKEIFEFMVEKGYTCKPYPRIRLNFTDFGNDILAPTGHLNPNENADYDIMVYVNGRGIKDIGRTLAHELIHWKQKHTGAIDKSGYTGDKISEDKNLTHLEAEAYLKGNFAFRNWTESKQKENKAKEMLNEMNSKYMMDVMPLSSAILKGDTQQFETLFANMDDIVKQEAYNYLYNRIGEEYKQIMDKYVK